MSAPYDDTDAAARYAKARAQIAGEESGGLDGVVGILHRLCRSLTANLDITGAAVILMSAGESDGVAAASDERSRALGELPFAMGEGPCHDAYIARRPVLTPDLREVPGGRWPGYASAALSSGVHAIFAFPLHVGAASFGVLDAYAERPGSLSIEQEAMALTFAQIATEILLDGDLTTPYGKLDPGLSTALDGRAEIHQAQGMVVVDLGIPPAQALARMRAYAFASGTPLIELARKIIDGLTLSDDDDLNLE
jgi:hypothetical protein